MQPAGGVHAGAYRSCSWGDGGISFCTARRVRYRSARLHGGAALGRDRYVSPPSLGAPEWDRTPSLSDCSDCLPRLASYYLSVTISSFLTAVLSSTRLAVPNKQASWRRGPRSARSPSDLSVITCQLLFPPPARPSQTGIVEAGPEVCAVSIRAPQQLPAAVGAALRILSYNILADQYAGSTFAQQVCVCVCVRGGGALRGDAGSTFAQQVRVCARRGSEGMGSPHNPPSAPSRQPPSGLF